MSKAYELVIPRPRFVVLVLCWTLTAILLFVAGIMSGLFLLPRYVSYSEAKTKPQQLTPAKFGFEKTNPATPQHSDCRTELTPAAQLTAESTASAPAVSAASPLDAVPRTQAAMPSPAAEARGASAGLAAGTLPAGATNSQKLETAPPFAAKTNVTANEIPAAETGAPAKHAGPPPADPYAVSLVVQVGSFKMEENAQHLAESLRKLGYKPEIVNRTDSHDHVWHVVRLGPYSEWNAASGVVMKLAANQELKPIVGPM